MLNIKKTITYNRIGWEATVTEEYSNKSIWLLSECKVTKALPQHTNYLKCIDLWIKHIACSEGSSAVTC